MSRNDSFLQLLVCAWCGRWIGRQPTDTWQPAQTLPAGTVPSHGMCPDCRKERGSGARPACRPTDVPWDGDGRR